MTPVGTLMAVAALVSGLFSLAVDPMPAEAGTRATRPIVVVDRSEVSIDDEVRVTIDGFVSPSVTISVCGNDASRGSGDCNMQASRGVRIDRDGGPTIVSFPVAAPPQPCPCVIRVAGNTQDELAIVPIRLAGHATWLSNPAPSDVITDPFVLTVEARSADAGFSPSIRKGLGGSARYDVDVVLRNRSTSTINEVTLVLTAGRNDGTVVATVDVEDPGEIEPGEVWRGTVQAELPSWSFGEIIWTAAVSSRFPAATASSTTSYTPVLLIVAIGVLAIDLVVLAVRLLRRRRRKMLGAADDDAGVAGREVGEQWEHHDVEHGHDREPARV